MNFSCIQTMVPAFGCFEIGQKVKDATLTNFLSSLMNNGQL